MKNAFQIIVLLALLLSLGCKTTQEVISEEPVIMAPDTEFRELDTMVISAEAPADTAIPESYELPQVEQSYHLKNDLVHTKLNLQFDWQNEWVIGTAELTLKPWFYPTNQLELDAKNFDIKNISLATGKELAYEYDGEKLQIQLNRTYQRTENYKVVIKYVAKPAEGEIGGSEAITSDQGLFFINADGKEDKPQQIWTQGETEYNSRWFPTIDKPNERCTQEIIMTVRDEFETLSNGVLIDSRKNADGTRTDHWKMEQPHAPYLFMIAVGDYAVVKERWRNIPVEYYVEPEYEADAKAIFNHTPEMLTFFSEKLGLDYMWPKYSQIVVRDYVSGAMENTTASIFGEQVQKTTRELIDNHNDYIVAHELFHHWFGDYVTCESWANLTMNEGFANYSEYLWFEHKYGREEADYHRINELNGYLQSAQAGGIHPLIWFENPGKEAMFDAHSYNKGGLVLHMLRHYVGDEAFFAALKKYLQDNAYTAVEAHDLRLAFEEVTGQDLNWFFNQWYFAAGHPNLKVDYGYSPETRTASVTIEQTQHPQTNPPVFQLPITIDIFETAGKVNRQMVMMTQRKQTFEFPVSQQPALINVDADKVLLAEWVDNKSEAHYIFQYQQVGNLMDRYIALGNLSDSDNPAAKELMTSALKDSHWFIRNTAINALAPDEALQPVIANLAKGDVHSEVRASALGWLTNAGYAQLGDLTAQILDTEKAYPVIGAALIALFQVDPQRAAVKAEMLENDSAPTLFPAIGTIYALQGRQDKLSFFENNWGKMNGPEVMDFFGGYGYLLQSSTEDITASLEKLKNLGVNQVQSPWRRFAATKTLFDLQQGYQQMAQETGEEAAKKDLQKKAMLIDGFIEAIKAAETNKDLKMIYQNF